MVSFSFFGFIVRFSDLLGLMKKDKTAKRSLKEGFIKMVQKLFHILLKSRSLDSLKDSLHISPAYSTTVTLNFHSFFTEVISSNQSSRNQTKLILIESLQVIKMINKKAIKSQKLNKSIYKYCL